MLSVVLSIHIARITGNLNYGKYSFACAYVAIFALFADLGYNTLMVRDISKDKSQANEYISNILAFRILLCIIILMSIIISINFLGYPAYTKEVVYIIGLYSLITSLSDVFRMAFRAFEIMEYKALTRVLSNGVRVLLGLSVLFLGYGIIEVSLVFLVSSIFDIIVSFLICRNKIVRPQIHLNKSFLKNTLKIAIPLATLSFFEIIFVRIDTIMLSLMKGDDVVGWYNAAYNLILGFKPIPNILLSVLLPIMSKYSVSTNDMLRKIYEESFKLLFLIGFPLAVGTTLFADRIITSFYGQQYQPSIIALQILAWDVFLIFSYSPLGCLLISINQEKKLNISMGITAILNVVLNLILIPRFSYIGSAIATIAAESVLFILYLYFVSKNNYKLQLNKIAVCPLIASLSMALFICFFRSLNLCISIVLSIFIYFCNYSGILERSKLFPERGKLYIK